MCGITGITDPRIGKLEESIQAMTRCIAHRGPDDDGFFIDEHVALGMRRLSIIDLTHGKQPIVSPDGRFLIFFNGEIYNYKELRAKLLKQGCEFQTESDTEVVLRLFEIEGPLAFKKLRGMFAVALYDTQEKTIVLARDPFGIKPLYYWKAGGRVTAFGSEIKSILQIPSFKAEVNDAAVYNYLSYQYNPLEETFFKNIFKLDPGYYLAIDLKTGVYALKRYYKFEFKPDERLEESVTAEKIRKTLEDSVSHHMIADVPVGSFLSGGIDSSIIATIMQDIRRKDVSNNIEARKVKTFTIGFETLSEGVEAKETAEPLGTDHKEIMVSADEYFKVLPKAVWHFDEPVADPSAIGIYFLSREARKEVKVVLSGEGSDELFGGYNIYLAPLAAEKIRWIPKFFLKLLTFIPLRGSNYAKRALRRLEEWYIGNASIFTPGEARAIWKGEKQVTHSLAGLYGSVTKLSDSTKMQHIDIHTWLIGDILAKADKMTMAHSLELRVPFLDVEVAKLAATLPDKFKWRNETTKYLLREAFRSVLPESTRIRKKLGFPTPVRNWFTKEREELYDTILENSYIRSHFDHRIIEKLISDHLSQKRDNSRKIYLLLLLSIWYNTFINSTE